MNITVVDRSNYFRGLLLLIRKDLIVTEPEIQLMRRIGKKLGFEREFCENAIHEVLENTYLIDQPPQFSDPVLAVKFIRDGLALAFSDHKVPVAEEKWLRSTAEKHGLDLDWFRSEYIKASRGKELPERLEVDDLTIES